MPPCQGGGTQPSSAVRSMRVAPPPPPPAADAEAGSEIGCPRVEVIIADCGVV